MERTDALPGVVCDAGPLIHLDELDALDLLGDFASVFVPHSVWNEVMRHRPALGPASCLAACDWAAARGSRVAEAIQRLRGVD